MNFLNWHKNLAIGLGCSVLMLTSCNGVKQAAEPEIKASSVTPKLQPKTNQDQPTDRKLNSSPGDATSAASKQKVSQPGEQKVSQPGEQRIEFAAGKSTATVNGAIVRGTQQIYRLNATAKQIMNLSATSPEGNAVVAVIGPNGQQLVGEESNTSLVLPVTGDYQVIVSSTRGNATYDLTVGIDSQSKPESTATGSSEAMRIEFDRGQSAAQLNGAIVRGEEQAYLLNAAKGQTISLRVTSPEDNAVVRLIAPNGQKLLAEESNTSLVLPATGDYQVIVGSMRGNAKYEMTVGVK